MPALGDEIEQQRRIEDLEKLCTRLQRQLATAKAKTADMVEAVYEGAKDAALVVGSPRPVTIKKDKRKPAGEVALLHTTDWQLGKTTESYSSEVCVERVMKMTEKVVKLTEIQRAAHPVRECVVMLGGDLVENTAIFSQQSWEVDSSTFAQVFSASSLIESMLLALLENFERVRVYEVAGNHGRIGRGKGQQSVDYERETNWDRIVGRIARERLADQKRLEWRVPDSWYELIKIGDYACFLTHGDQIRSFGGNTPAHGITRKCLAWSSGVTEPWTDAYMGHFHQPLSLNLANGGRVFVTPSTESGSEYAREFVAARGRPAQRLHFVDPDKGMVTAEYLIWLDQ